jgi:diadenosine tetraphosphate (Ap4A) HIT family hydrolase
MMSSIFSLDERLANDSIFLFDGSLSQFRLMNESRFPWLIIVPRIPDAVELIDLSDDQQKMLLAEVNQAAKQLRQHFVCDKLNIGALGNIVNQLHIHVVARNQEDAAWPNPVWGFGIRQPYNEQKLSELREELSTTLNATA